MRLGVSARYGWGMSNRIAIPINARFGRLTVIGGPILQNGKAHYRCRCDCGRETVPWGYNLRRGMTGSCGCLWRDVMFARHTKHGEGGHKHRTKLYQVWLGIKARCYDPNHTGYRYYGARGIAVCAAWRSSYVTFRTWALAFGYRPGLFIDRVNVDGDYEPQNCRWIDRAASARNRRDTTFLSAFGERKPLVEWAEDRRCVVPMSALVNRLGNGWRPEDALTRPSRRRPPRFITAFGERKTLSEWARDPRCCVGRKGLERRLSRGWSAEEAIRNVQLS